MGKTLFTPRHSLSAFFRSPSRLDVRTGGSQQKLTAHFAFNSIHKLNLAYTTRLGTRVSCLAQTGFAAFGKGVQLISGSPYAETEQLSRLTDISLQANAYFLHTSLRSLCCLPTNLPNRVINNSDSHIYDFII